MISIEEALEGSTPLAEQVRRQGPFPNAAQMVAAMRRAIVGLTDAEKVATLNAHPRIGAGRSSLSPRSLQEQGTETFPELDRLNDEYEQRFGFRFVVFVNRRPKSEIVETLRGRLRRTREEELQAGLEAIVDIAEDRLRG
jgi:2-oxo-4-hydroxy-4-carboxy--5-ureidoimidazoline (OHCU) decarboxylase